MAAQTTSPQSPVSDDGRGGHFPQTHWSMLQGVRSEEQPAALRALEQLCQAYWKPMYLYLRRRGLDREQAADDIQGFFHHLLSRQILTTVLPGHGRFRTFMLTTLRNWRSDQHRAATAQKRGGSFVFHSVEELNALDRAALACPSDNAEEIFDRRWARTLYDAAMARTRERYAERGRLPLFLRLSGMFTGQAVDIHDSIAADLGMSRGAVKQAALEMRQLFGSLLRHEVRQIVNSEQEVDSELRHLISLLK